MPMFAQRDHRSEKRAPDEQPSGHLFGKDNSGVETVAEHHISEHQQHHRTKAEGNQHFNSLAYRVKRDFSAVNLSHPVSLLFAGWPASLAGNYIDFIERHSNFIERSNFERYNQSITENCMSGALEKSLAIIEYLTAHPDGVALATIAKELHQQRSG